MIFSLSFEHLKLQFLEEVNLTEIFEVVPDEIAASGWRIVRVEDGRDWGQDGAEDGVATVDGQRVGWDILLVTSEFSKN